MGKVCGFKRPFLFYMQLVQDELQIQIVHITFILILLELILLSYT